MAGSLAYEVRGTLENAIDIYTTLLEVGKPYGILVQDEDGLPGRDHTQAHGKATGLQSG